MSKVLGIYVKFTKTTHQIWSCHVTLASNSKNFYFSPNSVLNVRESYQFWGNWLKNKKVTGKKQIGGGKHPPVLIGSTGHFDQTVGKERNNVIKLSSEITSGSSTVC